MARSRRGFGKLRKLPSGRWQASYVGPDGLRYTAPSTYTAKMDGEAWLSSERRKIEHEVWTPPTRERETPVTFAGYAEVWLAQRTLRARTRDLYGMQLRLHILPVLGDLPLRDITPATIREWHAGLGTKYPTRNSQVYRVVSVIFATAVQDEIVEANPCRIRGASATPKRVHDVTILDHHELDALADAMPPHLSASVLIAAWCGTRFGETSELRRRDLDKECSVLRIRRAVVYRNGGFEIGPTKTDAGVRDVSVPPHIRPALRRHLDTYVGPEKDALLFVDPVTGGHTAQYKYWRRFRKATAAIDHPDLRIHDLRHIGATMAAQAGASIGEVMLRLGHSTPDVAARYQHVAAGRDTEIAARLSKMVEES